MSKQQITISPQAAKRASSTTRSMFIALIVCGLFLIPVILVNIFASNIYDPRVDIQETTSQAQKNSQVLLASPNIDTDWYANYARWKSNNVDNISTWEIGIITSSMQHLNLLQGIESNDTWIANMTDSAPITGERTIGQHSWELRDKGNEITYLIFRSNESTIILSSKANFDELDILALSVTDSICLEYSLC